MTTVPPAPPMREPWPAWAIVLVVLLAVLVVLALLPSIAMAWMMTGSCVPMMGQLMQMMPGMMGR